MLVGATFGKRAAYTPEMPAWPLEWRTLGRKGMANIEPRYVGFVRGSVDHYDILWPGG